jgi:hypothetical protein
MFLCGGCAWWVKDLNKGDKNYDPLPVELVRVGQGREEVIRILGTNFRRVEASEEGEVLEWERWKAVMGPDYVEERLVVAIARGKVAKWRIARDTVEVVPRTW